MAFRCSIATATAFFLTCSLVLAQTADRRGFFAQKQKEYRQSVEQYPLLKQHRLGDLLHMHLDGNSLALDTPVEPDREYQPRRVQLDGVSEPAVVLCWLLSQDLGQVQFKLSEEDFSDPNAKVELHVMAQPNPAETGKQLENIDIERIWQTPNGFRRVEFNQLNTAVTLTVFANDGGPNGFINLNLTEADFVTLRQKHRAETEQWLRPILRELHQEAAFATDPSAAWQILADDWPTDDKLRAAVQGQIKALDDDDFHVREHAADELQKLGRDGALVMMKMDRTHLSTQQNLCLDGVISRFKPMEDRQARQLGGDMNFLLDCLYDDDPVARKLALQRLSRLAHQPLDFDLNADEDARVNAVATLRNKLLPPEAKGEKH